MFRLWWASRVVLFVCLLAFAGAATAFAQATVTTDKEQYSAGDVVYITGSGWQPGETVSLTVISDSLGTVRAALSAVADETGAIANSDLILGEQDVDVGFMLQAQGMQSGLTAETYFMDGTYVDYVSISPQSPNPVPPGQPATYTVTVHYHWWWFFCISKPVSWSLQWTGSVPQASYSFSPNPLDPPWYSCSAKSTLTITAAGNVAGGSYPFQVKACYGSSDCASTSGQLNITPDTTPPVPNVSSLPTIYGECSACAPTPTATDDRDGIIYGQAQNGPCFHQYGSHSIYWTFTDKAGNSSHQYQTVVVTDNHPPTITCPGNIVKAADPGKCTARIYFSASAYDNCSGTVHLYYNPNSGSDFPIGTTTVTCRAEDQAHNSSTCQFTVTVKDVTPPVIQFTSPYIVQAPQGECSARVYYTNGYTWDQCSSTHNVFSPPNGSVLPVGSTMVTVTASDASGNTSTGQFEVVVKDATPPVISCPENIAKKADANACGAVVAFSVSATDLCSEATVVATPPSGSLFPVGATIVNCTATDASGNAATCQFQITVNDSTPPVVVCPQDMVVMTDPGVCEAVVNFTPQASDNCSVSELISNPPSGSSFPIGTTTVACTATDPSGNSTTREFKVTVYNPAPLVKITGPPSGSLYAVGTPISLSGTFKDNVGDGHSAVWLCGETPVKGSVDESTKIVTGSCVLDAAGVYHISLTVADQCGGKGVASTVEGLEAMVVVYDPEAGFVTGGGWIDSPRGAYPADPALTGKANFGFVSKYQKGSTAPTGQTEFLFKVADLTFHSTSYEWLVIAGSKAIYKGAGTVNGEGDYGFMLSAIDGDISEGGGIDKFRIKIVDKKSDVVVYDNQIGVDESADPATALGGGSIVIHKAGESAVAEQPGTQQAGPEETLPRAYALLQNWPNPFNPTTSIPVELPAACAVRLNVYNVSGRLVRELADRWMAAGRHTIVWDGLDSSGRAVASGIYFCCIETHGFRATRRMVLLR